MGLWSPDYRRGLVTESQGEPIMNWKQRILSPLASLILFSPFCLAEKQDPEPPTGNESWQRIPLDEDREEDIRYGRGGWNRGSITPPGRGAMRGGRGFDSPPGPGKGRQAGRRERNRIDAEELIAFLEQYEPELAKKLDTLRQENKPRFARQFASLRRLYGPIMRMMEEDPEMAKVSLRAIRLRVQVQDMAKKAKKASDETSKKTAIQDLEGKLSELFDVILTLEELRLEDFKSRMEESDPWKRVHRQEDPNSGVHGEPDGHRESQRHGPGIGGGGRRFRGGRGGFGGGAGDLSISRSERGPGGNGRQRVAEIRYRSMEQKKKNIEIWKQNKERIIQQRVEELLKGFQPFPWRS